MADNGDLAIIRELYYLAENATVAEAKAYMDRLIGQGDASGQLDYARAWFFAKYIIPLASRQEVRRCRSRWPDDVRYPILTAWAWARDGRKRLALAELAAAESVGALTPFGLRLKAWLAGRNRLQSRGGWLQPGLEDPDSDLGIFLDGEGGEGAAGQAQEDAANPARDRRQARGGDCWAPLHNAYDELGRGNLDAAKKHLEDGLAAHPSSKGLMRGMVTVEWMLGDPEAAARRMSALVDRDPADIYPFLWLAQYHRSRWRIPSFLRVVMRMLRAQEQLGVLPAKPTKTTFSG